MRIPANKTNKSKREMSASDLQDLLNEAKKIMPKKYKILKREWDKADGDKNATGYQLKDIYSFKFIDVDKLEELSKTKNCYARFLLGHYHFFSSLFAKTLDEIRTKVTLAQHTWIQPHNPSIISLSCSHLEFTGATDEMFVRLLKQKPANALAHMGVTFLRREKGYKDLLNKKMEAFGEDDAVIWYRMVGPMLNAQDDKRVDIYNQLTAEYEKIHGTPKVIVEMLALFDRRSQLREKLAQDTEAKDDKQQDSKDQNHSILEAIDDGDLDGLLTIDRETLEKASLWLTKESKSGRNLLHAACYSDSPIAVIKFILEKTNLKINDVDTYGRTVLHHAAIIRNFELLEFLLAIDSINVCAADSISGYIPLHILLENDCSNLSDYQTRVLKLLIDKTEAVQEPFKASLIKEKARTHGKTKTIKTIPELPVSGLEVVDYYDRTAYDFMANSVPLEIIKHYIDKKIKTSNLQKIEGLLSQSVHREDISLLIYLVETFKLDLAKPIYSKEPLIFEKPLLFKAIEYGTVDIVRYLIERGVNVNECNIDGMYALHIAVEVGNLNKVEILVNTPSIQLNYRNKAGKTALDIAKDLGYNEIMILIEDAKEKQLAEKTHEVTQKKKKKGKKSTKVELTPASEPIKVDDLRNTISEIKRHDVKEITAFNAMLLQCETEITRGFDKLNSATNPDLRESILQAQQKIKNWKATHGPEFNRNVNFRRKMIDEYNKKIVDAETYSQIELKKIRKKLLAFQKSHLFIFHTEKLRKAHLDLQGEIKKQKQLLQQSKLLDPIAKVLKLLRGKVDQSKLEQLMDDYRSEAINAPTIRKEQLMSLKPEILTQIHNAFKKGLSQKSKWGAYNSCQRYLVKVIQYQPVFHLCFPEINKLFERLKQNGLQTIVHNWLIESCKNYSITRTTLAALIIIKRWGGWKEWCDQESDKDKEFLPKGWENWLLESTTARVLGISADDVAKPLFSQLLTVPLLSLKKRLIIKNKIVPIGNPLPQPRTKDEIKLVTDEKTSVKNDLINKEYWQTFKPKENPRSLEEIESKQSDIATSAQVQSHLQLQPKPQSQPIEKSIKEPKSADAEHKDIKSWDINEIKVDGKQEAILKDTRQKSDEKDMDIMDKPIPDIKDIKTTATNTSAPTSKYDSCIASLSLDNLGAKLNELFELLPEVKKYYNSVVGYLHAEDKQFLDKWIKKRVSEVLDKNSLNPIKRILLMIVAYGRFVELPNLKTLTNAEQFDKLTDILCYDIFQTETAAQLQVTDTDEFDLFHDFQSINSFRIEWQASKQEKSSVLKKLLNISNETTSLPNPGTVVVGIFQQPSAIAIQAPTIAREPVQDEAQPDSAKSVI